MCSGYDDPTFYTSLSRETRIQAAAARRVVRRKNAYHRAERSGWLFRVTAARALMNEALDLYARLTVGR